MTKTETSQIRNFPVR